VPKNLGEMTFKKFPEWNPSSAIPWTTRITNWRGRVLEWRMDTAEKRQKQIDDTEKELQEKLRLNQDKLMPLEKQILHESIKWLNGYLQAKKEDLEALK